MAGEKKQDTSKKELKQDSLIEKLVPDPGQVPPNVTALVGFLGKSAKENYWRLYLTPQLNEYVEVAEADIVNSESLSTETQTLAGTRLWVRKNATLQHMRVESRQVEAEMLSGPITTGFLQDLPGQALPLTEARRALLQRVDFTCLITYIPCQSADIYNDCTKKVEKHPTNDCQHYTDGPGDFKCVEPKCRVSL